MPPSLKNIKLVNGLEFFDVVKAEIGKRIVGMEFVLEKKKLWSVCHQNHLLRSVHLNMN